MKLKHLIIAGELMLQGCAQQNIILLSDSEVIAIPIVENHEPFVDLKNQTIIAYGPSPEIPNNTDYTKMRKTVYDKLVQAQTLLPKGLKLCVYEGYRSLELQRMLFNNRFTKVQALHPSWLQDQIFEETCKLVSPVINKDGSQNIPPHSTGAALDVYLIDEMGQPMDMGIQVKDWMEDADGSLSQTDSHCISAEAQQHRNIMGHALSTVGFINYPTEYWHWSYGDRYWAHRTEHQQAIYGSVK
jgi:D-alanyl-D-alanine dipeptidase